tara:strand:- start:51 stop:1046 length:996 start_codon:yes stop_codon:yes gene_type:complete
MNSYNIEHVDGYINLTNQPLNTCTDTCALTIKFYDDSTKFTMSNKGDRLLFAPISINKSNVIRFNSTEYMLKQIEIYKSSLHTYDNLTADAELIMTFVTTNNQSPTTLLLSIPITSGISTLDISKTVENLIIQANTKIPNTDDKGITSYGVNLNNLVPKKIPYYYYKQSENKGIVAYYAFDIKLSNSTMALFKRTVAYEHKIPLYSYAAGIRQVAPVSKNPNGASEIASSGDEIYIDCKPTGEEGKTEIKLEDKPDMISDEIKRVIAMFLKFLIAIILVRIIWFLPKLLDRSGKSGKGGKKSNNSMSFSDIEPSKTSYGAKVGVKMAENFF